VFQEPISGRQILGVFMLVAVAVMLLRALPPWNPYTRAMLREWRVRPPEWYGEPSRLDFFRTGGLVCLAGIAILVGSFLVLGTLMEELPFSSPARVWVDVATFATVLVSGMCMLGGVVVMGRGLFWKPWPKLSFVVLYDRVPVGETELDWEGLDQGVVGGGLRPMRQFKEVAERVDETSRRLRHAESVSEAKDIRSGEPWSIRSREGEEVAAHAVSVVNLEELAAGRGHWVEVTVVATGPWRARFQQGSGSDEGPVADGV